MLLFTCYSTYFYQFDKLIVLNQIVLPSFILSISLTLIHIILAKKSGVTNDYSTHQKLIIEKEFKNFDFESKLKMLTNWTLINKDDRKLVYKSNFNSIKSFGEIITIYPNKKETIIISKPVLFTTLFDFGKNYENLKIIKSII